MQKINANFFYIFREYYIPFDEKTAELIWHPRLSFLNLKSVEKLAGFGYKKLNQYYIYDDHSENMEMSEIIKVTIHCDFDFSRFPFDHQECNMSLYDPMNFYSWIIINEADYLCNNGVCKQEKEWIMLKNQNRIPYLIAMKNIGSSDHTFGDSDFYTESSSISTIKFSLQRNSLGLLIGSFYFPTGLFAFLSIGSYIIHPDIVSITLYYLVFRNKSLGLLFHNYRFLEGWEF